MTGFTLRRRRSSVGGSRSLLVSVPGRRLLLGWTLLAGCETAAPAGDQDGSQASSANAAQVASLAAAAAPPSAPPAAAKAVASVSAAVPAASGAESEEQPEAVVLEASNPKLGSPGPVASAGLAAGRLNNPSTRTELLDAGAPPRSALRYRFIADDAQRLQIKTTLVLSVRGPDGTFQKQPGVDLRLLDRVKVTALLSDSRVRREHHFDNFQIIPQFEVPAELRTAILEQAKALSSVFVVEVVSTRGDGLEFSVQNAPGFGSDELLDPLRSMVEQVLMPLPEQAIGVGARWKTLRELNVFGAKVDQVSEYKLVKQSGDELVVEVSAKQSAAPGPVMPDQLPEGGRAEIISLAGSLQGQRTVNLKTHALDLSFKQSQDSEIWITANGTTNKVATKTQADSSIVTLKAP